VYAWAQVVKKLGVPNAEKGIALYEEISGITLRPPNRQSIRNAFEAKAD
jgi:hypothetical protein